MSRRHLHCILPLQDEASKSVLLCLPHSAEEQTTGLCPGSGSAALRNGDET